MQEGSAHFGFGELENHRTVFLLIFVLHWLWHTGIDSK